MIENLGPKQRSFEKSPTAGDIVAQKERVYAKAETLDSENGALDIQELTQTFARFLELKYPSYDKSNMNAFAPYKRIVALSELSGTGGYDDVAGQEDFEGDDSVKKFLNELEFAIDACSTADELKTFVEKRQQELDTQIKALEQKS